MPIRHGIYRKLASHRIAVGAVTLAVDATLAAVLMTGGSPHDDKPSICKI